LRVTGTNTQKRELLAAALGPAERQEHFPVFSRENVPDRSSTETASDPVELSEIPADEGAVVPVGGGVLGAHSSKDLR
jgi:hypothetical protein